MKPMQVKLRSKISIGFTNFFRCLIFDLFFFTNADVVTIKDETSKYYFFVISWKCLALPKWTQWWLLSQLDSGFTIWIRWISENHKKSDLGLWRESSLSKKHFLCSSFSPIHAWAFYHQKRTCTFWRSFDFLLLLAVHCTTAQC